jgi:uncharacterized membrane protein
VTASAPAGPSTGRTEAFSDGVLAIAITLLVLEIQVPHVTANQSLTRALLDLWPKYAAFAVSFLTIGIMWINHHALFDRVAAVDRRMLFMNILLLLTISFLPFPTAVLGDYIQSGDAGHVAAAFYSASLLLVGLGFLALWIHLLAHPELRAPGFTDDGVRLALRRTIVGPIIYAVGIAVAFVSPYAALVLFAGLAVYFAVGRFSLPDTTETGPDPDR